VVAVADQQAVVAAVFAEEDKKYSISSIRKPRIDLMRGFLFPSFIQ
jgi:hypothetical protein